MSREALRAGAVRRWLLLGLGLLLAGAAAGGWWWLRRPGVEPPLPEGIRDPEVHAAIVQARQAVLAQPRSADAWGHLGMTLEAHLFEPEADRCFAEAAHLDPSDPRWPYFRGLYALKYTPETAISFLRQAVEAAGSREDVRSPTRLRLAEALLERQDVAGAEELFRAEWHRTPGNGRAALGLGLIALERDDRSAADEFLTAARASPLTRKRATAHLATLARVRGDSRAAADYDKELASLPNDLGAWPDALVDEILSLQVGRRNRVREAEELERQRRFGEAAELYLRQIEEQPSAAAYVGAALNLARLRDYDRALTLLRQGVRLEPDNARVHFTLAQVLFIQAEKQEPGSHAAREGFGAALEPARRATELKPDHAQAYLFWGLALTHLGKAAEALAPLRQGVACRPEDLELQLALGEALLDAGQLAEAEVHLQNAVRLASRAGSDPRPEQALERLRKKK